MDDQKDLPLPDGTLPKPEKDLPLPEKEITSGTEAEEGKVINDQNSSYAKTDNNLGGKAILAIILLIFLYPIGVILMWFGTKWPKWVKFLLTIPFILGIIGFIIAIFFLSKLASSDLTDKMPPSTIQVASPTPTPELIPFPTLTASEAATWKTYTDSKSTISIMYPPYMTYYDSGTNNEYNGTIAVQFFIKSQNLNKTGVPNNTQNMAIAWRGNENGLNNESVKTELNGMPANKKYIEFNNVYGIQIGDGFNYYFTEKNKNNLVYRIMFDNNFVFDDPNESDRLISIFEKMLSTFKFTEPDVMITAPPGANPTDGSMVACTMEAKLCPDGVTSVGRSGPNCEFEKCPGE